MSKRLPNSGNKPASSVSKPFSGSPTAALASREIKTRIVFSCLRKADQIQYFSRRSVNQLQITGLDTFGSRGGGAGGHVQCSWQMYVKKHSIYSIAWHGIGPGSARRPLRRGVKREYHAEQSNLHETIGRPSASLRMVLSTCGERQGESRDGIMYYRQL